MQNEPSAEQHVNRTADQRKKPVSFWARLPVILVGSLFLALILFLGLQYFIRGLTHESTDDAFLDGHIIAVAPKVAAQVSKVHVRHNQPVKAGDLLLELDSRDFEIQRDQKAAAAASARANVQLLLASLELLKAQVATAEATARQTAAEAAAAQATAEKAQADLKRAEELFRATTISAQEFDTAKTAAAAALANLKAAQEKGASDRSKVEEVRAQLEAGRKAYERGEAQSHQAELDIKAAELNLSYIRVTAPQDGYVTRRSVEEGDYLQVGQRIMSLVTTQLWVTANFKETQLKLIRTNQPALIVIDSLGGHEFAGHVESIQAGSGARFSLLPPENAVGNYVKVVQRVPVRIFFDEPVQADHVLGPGMSVSPSIKVKEYQLATMAVLALALILGAILGGIWFLLARRRGAAGPTPSAPSAGPA